MLLELSRSRPNVVKLDSESLRWPVEDELFEDVLSLVEDNAWTKVKLDLAKVDFLSGAGLGKIVSLYQKLKDRNVGLVLQHVSEHVLEVFTVTGLTRILDIRR